MYVTVKKISDQMKNEYKKTSWQKLYPPTRLMQL
jgi:hypothetical protein